MSFRRALGAGDQLLSGGHVLITILQRSGALVRSILADWSPAEAVAGTNLVYAATHSDLERARSGALCTEEVGKGFGAWT